MTTISIYCVHCHKRYNAPATMAGKKVKCKHCGKVFAIPADAAEPAQDEIPQAGAPAAPSRAVAKPEASAGEGGSKAAATGKLGQANAGYAARIARNENAVEVEFADAAAPIVMLRPSIPHDFPGAAAIDQWLPPLMAMLGLGLLSMMAIRSNTSTEGWVGTTRLVAYLFLCLVVAFPLGYFAVSHAAGKCRFMLPPAAQLRALGAFSLSFALPLVFWLLGGSIAMLVIGSLMGLVLLAASIWFLFRLQTQEMSTVFGEVSAAFLGSIVFSYLALLGVNVIFAHSARLSGTNQLVSSPMGPTFDWDVPLGEGPKPKPNPKHVARLPDNPTTVPTTEPGAGVIPTTIASTTIPTTTAVIPANGDTVIATIPSTAPTAGTQSVAKPATEPVVVAPAALSPLVAKITPVADLGDFNQIVFPPGGGNLVVAGKKSETEETVAFFSGSPLTLKGETKFEVEKDLAQKFCLSASGETLARLTEFPKLGVLLWNTSTNKEAKVVPLNPTRGKPELLGFGFNDNLVVLWNTGSFIDVEVINTRGNLPQTVTSLRLKTFERSPCNPTISPDGRQMAVATFIEKKGGIDLWDLTTSRKAELRTCYVPLGTWVTPTSMTYAATGGQFAAYFELGTKGVIYSFRTGDGGLLHEFPYRTLPYPAGVAETFSGRTLDYLDANDWLLLGRPILDTETGKVLGDLQIDNARAQRVLDKDTLLIHTQSAEGKNQLLEVKLKGDVIAAKRAEVRSVKPLPKTP